MGSPLLHVGALALCPHGGAVTIIPGQTRVTAGGLPAATMADAAVIAGCQFKPPCVKAQFVLGSLRITLGGVPALLSTSTALAVGAAPQGTVVVARSQTRALGS
ncbi:MAG: hypothetical protein EPO40_03290 [Myxococcaceae bacterium]|nr:MAG: hypothetical protein EPO40_03290 [Myxococcaceae bacterium]